MSEDLPFYSPFRTATPPARTKLSAERLWELHRDGRRARGGIVVHKDPEGYEFMLFVDAHFIESRRFGYRDHAVSYGEKVRGDYVGDGWQEGNSDD